MRPTSTANWKKRKRYSVNGEYGTEIQTFRGAQRFGLRAYDTMLGGFDYKTDKTLQWFYELLTDIPPEQSRCRAELSAAGRANA